MTSDSKFFMKPKKIPYYLLLTFLTAGASLILGFLSFGGMYAIAPILPLAFATFGLSVAYEGEIYLQNIKGACKKLFKPNTLEYYLAKEYLLKNLTAAVQDQNCPPFFKEYKKQQDLLLLFHNKPLNKLSKQRKKNIEKTLKDMEKWFAQQLFATKNTSSHSSNYANALKTWLKNHDQAEWLNLVKQRHFFFNLVKAFSTVSGLFMTLGTTYLIIEAFSVIPIVATIPFALWPIMIIPMALIAGVAYGMLTYNTITDLINNETLTKWYHKIRYDLSNELSLRTVFVATMALFLVAVALALTICTAGTWWTVATKTRPLFSWMEKMPSFVMGGLHPLITGLSTMSFNVENIAESMEMVDEATRSPNPFRTLYDSIKKGFTNSIACENWLQLFNPFRILLKLTITPLQILLFFGHLVSYALTADRMPGVPQIISALIAITSEGFEDAHYFIGENNELDHKKDIPSRLINMLALPLHALAASWDYLSSKLNTTPCHEITKPKVLTFKEAWDKQCGTQLEEDVPLPNNEQSPSKEWQAEHALLLITKHQKNHLNNTWIAPTVANDKQKELSLLKDKISASITNDDSLNDLLTNAKQNAAYNRHRLFATCKGQKTATQLFIENLPNKIMCVA